MPVQVVRKTRFNPVFPLGNGEIHDLCDAVLTALGHEDAWFSLQLVDDEAIATVNAAFLGCTGPTNVLSFPAAENGPDDDGFLGEIVLSVDTLEREVHLYGQDEREHLARLLAHAVLHLAGYDHGEEMDSLTDLAVAVAATEDA